MSNKLIKIYCALFGIAFIISPVYSVRARPGIIRVNQKDGTMLSIKLNGDEHFHFHTTSDGFLIKQDSQGIYKYAFLENGRMKTTDRKAKNEENRNSEDAKYMQKANVKTITSQISTQINNKKASVKLLQTTIGKSYPMTGSPKALVILANFSDNKFSIPDPQSEFQDLVSQSGYSANGATGSARDYFLASSYGKFAPNFEVVGPVTLPQTMTYYGANDILGNDTIPAQMIVDACAAADAAGVDFSQYDNDNDGYVDNVFVYYAGYNEAEGASSNTIWPHRWDIASAGITTGITFDGKTINDYSCTSELKGNSGTNMCGIGTFCHEFGHVLGLPDFYDTSGNQENTLNTWDIMDYGPYLNEGRTPPTYSAYERFFLGFLTPLQCSSPYDLTLQPLGTSIAEGSQQTYILSASTHNLSGTSPNPKEFFMIEYRKHTGFDTYLGQAMDSYGNFTTIPSDGMCIWHIDYLQSAWDNNTPNNYTGTTQTSNSHMRVYLQPVSGNTSTPGTTFSSGSFTPTTWSGTNINRALTEITTYTDKMTAKLMGGYHEPVISTDYTVFDFQTSVGAASATQTFKINGNYINADMYLSLLEQSNFDIKLSSTTSWSKSIQLSPNSGIISENIDIRYNPTNSGIHSDKLAITTNDSEGINLILNGIASQSVISTDPQILVGQIETKIEFPQCSINGTKSKTFNLKTSNLHGDLVLTLSGTDSLMFAVSASQISKSSANKGTDITITYSPTSSGNHSALLTINGGGLVQPLQYSLSGYGR